MGGIGHYNYQQYPLAQKYAWFQSGPGAAAAMQVSDSLKRIAARLDVSDGTIGAGFVERNLGTTWRGSAATAASGAFDRAAAVLASLTSTSQAGGGTAQQFGDSFNATKNAIPVPPPPTGANSTMGRDVDDFADSVRDRTGADLSVLGVQSDYRARLVANRNAELVADDALYRHENTTRDALAAYQSAVGSSEQRSPSARVGTGPATFGPAGGGAPAGAAGGGSPGAGGHGRGGTAAGAGGSGATAGGDPAGGAARRGAGTAGSGGVAGATWPAGEGPHGGTAGTESAGWSPLDPGRSSIPSGSVDDPGVGYGGHAPSGGYAGPGPGSGGGFGARGVSGGYGSLPGSPGQAVGGTSGYRGGPVAEQTLPPRTGEGAPGWRGGAGTAAGTAGGAAAGRPTGQGAMAPMGWGGAAAGGQGRDHRNQFYIPEDEPFRVEYDFYVAPPVIGAGIPGEDPQGRTPGDGPAPR